MTTGGNGIRFSPGHILAGFPTDSGYLRVALEEGFIGLILILILYWVVLKESLFLYFSLKDPDLKIYALGFLLTLYSLIVANLTQDAISEIPNEQIFFIICAFLIKLPEIDRDYQNQTSLVLL